MKRQGFTLIELLAVVLIMGILTAVALPQYRKSLERSRLTEARQMLPAIYDARERLIAERGETWPAVITETPEWAPSITFIKLDIEMKGKADAGDPQFWRTDTFNYSLFDRIDLGGRFLFPVTAKFTLGGTYAGTFIYYDGDGLMCCNGEDNAKCEALGFAASEIVTYCQ